MKVIFARRVKKDRSGGNHTCIGTVDVELNPDLRLHGLRLMLTRGRYLVYAPQSRSNRTATFSRPLAEQLTALACEALGVAANDE
ncbi:hypothetical protein GCM10007989_01980 [Devosia pacifica]|uniref:Uncharacterized protein n=1 Tax=Devosia pacifica TaxID=1335967 RepID=A0A918RVT8_9HYPH|nr:hypothetical protein GCM10007989_01980 [Devosia pacifica]